MYDNAMAQRLSALQQYMPVAQENIDYQAHGNTPVTSAGQVAGAHPFTLPSLRTKQEIVEANNFLTELSHNLYDSSAPTAAAAAAAATASAANYAQSGQSPVLTPALQTRHWFANMPKSSIHSRNSRWSASRLWSPCSVYGTN